METGSMREQAKHTESSRISDEKNRTSGAFLSVYSVWRYEVSRPPKDLRFDGLNEHYGIMA
jgi:hypothetical protein